MRYGLTIALMLAWTGMGWGQAFVGRVGSLKGASQVGVAVVPLSPEAEQDGLSRRQLQTDVELRLRKAGIIVRPEEENRHPGVPWLFVEVVNLRLPTGLCAYAIGVSCRQLVILYRDEKIVVEEATTWQKPLLLATVGANNMPASVRGDVGDMVDEFINDWLTANPVKR